jgi:hypothetical protein
VKSNNEKNKNNDEGVSRKLSPSDFYIEYGKYVFTEEFHLKRGVCCNSGCRHCPYKNKIGDSLNGSRPTASI